MEASRVADGLAGSFCPEVPDQHDCARGIVGNLLHRLFDVVFRCLLTRGSSGGMPEPKPGHRPGDPAGALRACTEARETGSVRGIRMQKHPHQHEAFIPLCAYLCVGKV